MAELAPLAASGSPVDPRAEPSEPEAAEEIHKLTLSPQQKEGGVTWPAFSSSTTPRSCARW